VTRPAKIPVSEHGIPLGDHHHRTKIPDAAVKAMFEMKDDGMGWRRIARAFPEWSPWTIRDILASRRRNVQIADWKDA